MKILLKVSGSIACFKAAALASKLVQNGFEVQTVMTRSASDFIGVGTFEGLTGKRVARDLFEEGHRMEHITLERWADLTLFYPASANSIAKLAQGSAEDLVSTLFLAHDFKRPYWLAPAMNPSMFSHPAVQANLNRLESYGVELLSPGNGRMACGEYGEGRLVEPEDLLARLVAYRDAAKKSGSILVTAGGTFDPIDSVRGITNNSTGETGVRLAESLSQAGFSVKLLLAKTATYPAPSRPGIQVERFTTYADLDQSLKNTLSQTAFDACIHSAAVGDFDAIVEGSSGKISSSAPVSLTLKPRTKILSRLKGYSMNPKLKLVSFKLTSGEWDEKRLENEYAMSDLGIRNDLAGYGKGGGRNEGGIYVKTVDGFKLEKKVREKREIFGFLQEWLGHQEVSS